jgi:phosphatidylserine decarboxylase
MHTIGEEQMAEPLDEWVSREVDPLRDRPLSELSQQHFFRDPSRPIYTDPACFLAPADGVLLYQETVKPDEPLVDIKGKPYSLRTALRDDDYDKRCLVIGIFMTFFDVHVNRVPYPGRLSWKLLDPIETYNQPMLDVEKSILDELRIAMDRAGYLYTNQRVLNRVDSHLLREPYYVLQIADYDVDSITPFDLRQRQPVDQGHRFSMIRYGSQVDLIIPVDRGLDLETVHQTGHHVKAGVDAVVRRNDL